MSKNLDERCLPPIRAALNILGGKWSFLVIVQLSIGRQRFNQLRKNLADISTKALTDTLRHLENNGVVNRQVFPTVPVTVEYSLTEKGHAFRRVLIEMYNWGNEWGDQQDEGPIGDDFCQVS